MNRNEFNMFCGSLAAASHGVQWGGAEVWKVGAWDWGKVFVIGRWADGETPAASFKVSDIGWEMLRDARGCRPAPYLASRGMKWIQADLTGGLTRSDIQQLIAASHGLAAANLTLRRRKEIGLS